MKRGRAVTFHGALGSKADARRKEHRVSGGVHPADTIGGHRRFLVLSRNPSPAAKFTFSTLEECRDMRDLFLLLTGPLERISGCDEAT